MISSKFKSLSQKLSTNVQRNTKLQNRSSTTSSSALVSENDKLIFLDVDGVLNDYRSLGCHGAHGGGKEFWEENIIFQLFNKNVNPFVELMKQCNAKVVLSSTWRSHSKGTQFLAKNVFEPNNIEYIGNTPIKFETQLAQKRFDEIIHWLKYNINVENEISSNETKDDNDINFLSQLKISWVAIDDDPYYHMTNFIHNNPHLPIQNKLVKTDSNEGFTTKHIDETLKKLQL